MPAAVTAVLRGCGNNIGTEWRERNSVKQIDYEALDKLWRSSFIKNKIIPCSALMKDHPCTQLGIPSSFP